jgi:hypothetical protein
VVWDLAAMSIAEQEILIPDYALKDGKISLNRLEDMFDPLGNVPLCALDPDKGRLVYCMEKIPYRAGDALPSDKVSPLFNHWVNMILTHPSAYLDHRMNLMCHMLHLCPGDEVPFNYGSTQPSFLYQPWYEGPDPDTLDIPRYSKPSPEGRAIITTLIDLFHSTPLISPWFYMLILAAATVAIPLLMPRGSRRSVAMGVIVSGWMMALPLFVIAPNFQLRYIIWPMLAAILSLLLFRRSNPKEAEI